MPVFGAAQSDTLTLSDTSALRRVTFFCLFGKPTLALRAPHERRGIVVWKAIRASLLRLSFVRHV